MIGRNNTTWYQFTQDFLARFGKVDTELVFDKFKKLQQTTAVEAYFDECEKCRGQLLLKILSLTIEYFLENFILRKRFTSGYQRHVKVARTNFSGTGT